MMNENEKIRVSKFLSLVLRHRPEMIGLEMDGQGWVLADELLQKLPAKGIRLDRVMLEQIVETSTKKRFAFNEDKTRIRASQGHSVSVDLGYSISVPPPFLYHGTAKKNIPSILQQGLMKMSRQHVHLSTDTATAMQVGKRHGKPVVIEVSAGRMYQEGYSFYLSANFVWLTDAVPAAYLRLIGE